MADTRYCPTPLRIEASLENIFDQSSEYFIGRFDEFASDINNILIVAARCDIQCELTRGTEEAYHENIT